MQYTHTHTHAFCNQLTTQKGLLDNFQPSKIILFKFDDGLLKRARVPEQSYIIILEFCVGTGKTIFQKEYWR